LRWWESTTIKKYVNKVVCNYGGREKYTIISAGSNQYLKILLKQENKVLKHGVLLFFGGGGGGEKEFLLVQEGIVEKFTLFELSDERIKLANKRAKQLGIKNKIKIIKGNYFEYIFDEKIDFVHWNNSLHHMFDVDKSIKWSYDILEDYGIFYMDDYVGFNRFQFSDNAIKLCNDIRSLLPDLYLKNPFNPDELCTTVQRTNPEALANRDPSEAPDSENILNSLIKYFPNVKIILTGGTVYHTALNDILNNFDENCYKDKLILELLMFINQLALKQGIKTQYAFVIAIKKPKIDKYSIKNLITGVRAFFNYKK